MSSTVSGDKLCCSRSICNVTTQALEGGCVDAWMSGLFCLWDGPVRVHRVTAGQAYVCATLACATDTNAAKHRVNVIDSWAKGPLAPFWFPFSLEASSGNSDASCSLSANQLFAVLKTKIEMYLYGLLLGWIIIILFCFFLLIIHSLAILNDLKAFKVSSLIFFF